MQSTQAVARDINPEFNCTLTMPMRERGEVLRVTLRDFGMLGSTPKVVATATLLAGEEFTGHLEMAVSSAKRELGNPVLQLIVRWAWYDVQDPARPAATVEAMSQQAASAPALMEAIPEADGDVGALGRDRSSSSSSVFFGHRPAQARLTNHTSKFNILCFIECQNVLFQISLLSCGCGGGVVFPMRRSLDLQASSCSLCLQCLTGSVACMLLGGVDCVAPVLDV